MFGPGSCTFYRPGHLQILCLVGDHQIAIENSTPHECDFCLVNVNRVWCVAKIGSVGASVTVASCVDDILAILYASEYIESHGYIDWMLEKSPFPLILV